MPLEPIAVVAQDGSKQSAGLRCGKPAIAQSQAAIAVQGYVKTWRPDPTSTRPNCNCTALSYIEVRAYAAADLNALIAEGNSGSANGAPYLSLPSGSPSVFHLLAMSFLHPTYTMNVRMDVAQPAASYDMAVVYRASDSGHPSVVTLERMHMAIGTPGTEGKAVLIGKVVDCEGRPIAHAVVTLSTPEVVGVATPYYFSVAPNDLPAARTSRWETDSKGEFFIPEIPARVGTFTLRAYGFLTEGDVVMGAPGLRVISTAELPIPAEAPTIGGTSTRPATVLTEMFPTEGPL